jgi:predicted Zn-dependent peptidase
VQPREALAGTGIDLMCTVSGGELPARVLADAIVDRLERQLRDEAGVSYGVAASVVGDGTSRLLSVSTVVADAAVGDAVVAFQSAVDQLAATSPDVRRYRLMVAREIGGGWRGMDSVARRLEEAFLEGRSIADVSTLPEELAAVDGAAVQRLAASCAANRQVFVVGSSAALATIEAKGIAVGAAPE